MVNQTTQTQKTYRTTQNSKSGSSPSNQSGRFRKPSLIVNLPNLETKINRELFLNDKEILITHNKIKMLKDSMCY